MQSILFEPAHEILVLIAYASHEGSGVTAQMRSPARAITARTHVVWN